MVLFAQHEVSVTVNINVRLMISVKVGQEEDRAGDAR